MEPSSSDSQTGLSFDDYVNVDQELPTVDLPSDDEVLRFLSYDNNVVSDNDCDDIDVPNATDFSPATDFDMTPLSSDGSDTKQSLVKIYNALKYNLFTTANVMECFAVLETHLLTIL